MTVIIKYHWIRLKFLFVWICFDLPSLPTSYNIKTLFVNLYYLLSINKLYCWITLFDCIIYIVHLLQGQHGITWETISYWILKNNMESWKLKYADLHLDPKGWIWICVKKTKSYHPNITKDYLYNGQRSGKCCLMLTKTLTLTFAS